MGEYKLLESTQQLFKDIYTEHATSVRNLLYRMGVGADLDDLVQDTFVKIYHSLDNFEARSSMKTWIFSVAINTARDHHRRKKRQSWLSFFADDTYELTSHEQTDAQIIDRQQIEISLKALSPKLRETMILHSLEDLDLQEIANILQIPLGTVKSRLHEARNKLKSLQLKGE